MVLVKTALSGLYHAGLHRVLRPLTAGVGAILMLHRVVPEDPAPFAPNASLKVAPTFLEAVLSQVLGLGFEIVSLDEARRRLVTGDQERPFVCITFDDGYRDNRDLAYPILKRFNAPFTIYVPTDFPEGKGLVWWECLERIIGLSKRLRFRHGGEVRDISCTTLRDKRRAYCAVVAELDAMEQRQAHALLRELCEAAEIDPERLCRELIMSWDELRALDADPLVTIGAHTMSHVAVGRLPGSEARQEIEGSLARLGRELGDVPRHFSFPYGDAASAGAREFDMLRDLGLETGVTTIKGVLTRSHAHNLTGLPRLPINGLFQNRKCTEVLLSGLPSALSGLSRALPRAFGYYGGSVALRVAERRPRRRSRVYAISEMRRG